MFFSCLSEFQTKKLQEITVTNYTGESREYLKKLIMAMGATFTPSMSGKNTVLIAA
jgi:twin BRCT domain